MALIEKYNRTGALVIGIMQIVLAVALVATQGPMYIDWVVPAYGGAGFWTGVFFGICGGLAVASWKNNTRCLIIAVMAMDILATVVALGGIATISAMAIIGAIIYTGRCPPEETYKLSVDLSIAQTIMCLIELILAIVGSTLCCAGVCETSDEVQVMYVTSGQGVEPQQQVVIVGQQTAGAYPHGGQPSAPYLQAGDMEQPYPQKQ